MSNETQRKKPGRRSQAPVVSGWTHDELGKLIEGVKRYRIDDYENIQRLIPTKTVQEVEKYLKSSRLTAQSERSKLRCRREKGKEAPIESWLDLAGEIVYYEPEDHSKMMAKAMAVISHFETFPEPQSPSEPNYRRIYQYLSALLMDMPLPELSQIESAIMLSLMEDLLKELRQMDLNLHRKLLLWKYNLLNDKVDIGDVKKAVERSRQALSNDFSAIIPIRDMPTHTNVAGEGRVDGSSNGVTQVTYPGSLSSSTFVGCLVRTDEGVREVSVVIPSKTAPAPGTDSDPLHSVKARLAKKKTPVRRKKTSAPREHATETVISESPVDQTGTSDTPSTSCLSDPVLAESSELQTRVAPSSSSVSTVASSQHTLHTDASGSSSQPLTRQLSGGGGEACEIFHWPDSTPKVHLVYNHLTSCARSEPCSCTDPKTYLPSREEARPVFFFESEVRELQRLSGQTRASQGESTPAGGETLWDLGFETEKQRSKRGRKPVHSELQTMKKPRLLSINPLCIPTELIKMRKRHHPAFHNPLHPRGK